MRSPPRRYDASKRQEKAAQARRRILAAAATLFSDKGIDPVTLAQVATKARVSSASVYAQFRSKAGLLEALIHSILLGQDYQAAAARVDGVDDPAEALRITASMACGVYQREHKELGLIRAAAAYSPALRKIEAGLETVRWDLQKERARLVYRSNPALKAWGLKRVRDVIWMFTGRDFYRMLVLEKGWTPQTYERWLAQSLIQILLNQGG